MELRHILQQAGFAIATKASDGDELLLINNPDGSVRWCWPARVRHPLVLKFYNMEGRRARILATIIQLVFLLGIQRWIFRKAPFRVVARNPSLSQHPWALFTGTPGPYRKAVVYVDGTPGVFMKVALGTSAEARLENEAYTLLWLQHKALTAFRHPHLLHHEGPVLEQSEDLPGGQRDGSFSEAHLRALVALQEQTIHMMPLRETLFWQNIQRQWHTLKQSTDLRFPAGLLRKLDVLLKNLNPDALVQTSTAHGDFTPWNMFRHGDLIYLYDWELSETEMPAGFDAFHFFVQKGILSENKNWSAIRRDLQAHPELATLWPEEATLDEYLQYYLLTNTIHYLQVYAQQAEWHKQVYWLLQVWNEALSDLLSTHYPARALVAMDALDALHPHRYAALKYADVFPEELSEHTDIDICLPQSQVPWLTQYIQQHVLVRHHHITRRSHMYAISVLLQDGTSLSIDLIWRVKRKHLEFLPLQDLLPGTILNQRGVRIPSPDIEARYIALFYLLNNSPVPDKYISRLQDLDTASEPIDQALSEYYHTPSPEKNQHILHLLAAQPENRGRRRLKNVWHYMMDTLRSLMGRRGMVITFSGVDGAGKSTVIEKVRVWVEKLHRKRVVVLRHRPSLLPILSAWQKGKSRAEQDAASTLPRQGKNRSILSSMLRFLYYYSDYLFGQLYIYVRYILRGDIVLYDRYYFDFINDSRRSNIDLPASITQWGYRLLLKPDLNFFLYADADLILKRKQELSSETIEKLTTQYLSLFDRLNRAHRRARYIPIENVDLDQTLHRITHTIQSNPSWS